MTNLGAVRNHGFDRKWIFTIPCPSGTHNASIYQISTKNRQFAALMI